VHRALWEYLVAANEDPDEAERERLRKEVFEGHVAIFQRLRIVYNISIAARSFWQKWFILRMAAESFGSFSPKELPR
jgi:hypothetical protein